MGFEAERDKFNMWRKRCGEKVARVLERGASPLKKIACELERTVSRLAAESRDAGELHLPGIVNNGRSMKSTEACTEDNATQILEDDYETQMTSCFVSSQSPAAVSALCVIPG